MEEWIIYKEFRFEAAHRLPNYHGKCNRLHGHSWVGRIHVKGNKLVDQGSQQGMLIDYGDISEYIQPLLDKFLHQTYISSFA